MVPRHKTAARNIAIGIGLAGITGIIISGVLLTKQSDESKNPENSILMQSTKPDLDSALTQKNLQEIDNLVEIPNVKDAIVMEVTDQKMIREFDPLFGRSYKGDLIIFLPDQTIVFDPVTKTVRDIISKSFYEEVKGEQK